MIEALFKAGLRRYCFGGGLASKQGIISDLSKSFAGVKLIDEAGHFFANILDKNAAGHKREIGSTLTQLSTSATKVFFDDTKAADRDPDTVIYDTPHPCYCLFATTIKSAFWGAMHTGNADDGSLARFMLFEAPDLCPDPVLEIEPIETRLDAIAARLQELIVGPGVEPTEFALSAALSAMQAQFTTSGKKTTRTFHVPNVPVVPMSDGAKALDHRPLLGVVEDVHVVETLHRPASVATLPAVLSPEPDPTPEPAAWLLEKVPAGQRPYWSEQLRQDWAQSERRLLRHAASLHVIDDDTKPPPLIFPHLYPTEQMQIPEMIFRCADRILLSISMHVASLQPALVA